MARKQTKKRRGLLKAVKSAVRKQRKRATTRKKLLRQIGKSNIKRDKLFVAKKPGKRVSASGNVYYERRRNRSDKNRRKRL